MALSDRRPPCRLQKTGSSGPPRPSRRSLRRSCVSAYPKKGRVMSWLNKMRAHFLPLLQATQARKQRKSHVPRRTNSQAASTFSTADDLENTRPDVDATQGAFARGESIRHAGAPAGAVPEGPQRHPARLANRGPLERRAGGLRIRFDLPSALSGVDSCRPLREARDRAAPDLRRASRYRELRGIDWTWQAADAKTLPAPLGGQKTGPNPTDLGKCGTKRHLLIDGRGVPLSVYLSAANRHDIKGLSGLIEKGELLTDTRKEPSQGAVQCPAPTPVPGQSLRR